MNSQKGLQIYHQLLMVITYFNCSRCVDCWIQKQRFGDTVLPNVGEQPTETKNASTEKCYRKFRERGSTELSRRYNERLLDCLDVRERGELESERSSHPSQSCASDVSPFPSTASHQKPKKNNNTEEPAYEPVKSHNLIMSITALDQATTNVRKHVLEKLTCVLGW